MAEPASSKVKQVDAARSASSRRCWHHHLFACPSRRSRPDRAGKSSLALRSLSCPPNVVDCTHPQPTALQQPASRLSDGAMSWPNYFHSRPNMPTGLPCPPIACATAPTPRPGSNHRPQPRDSLRHSTAQRLWPRLTTLHLPVKQLEPPQLQSKRILK